MAAEKLNLKDKDCQREFSKSYSASESEQRMAIPEAITSASGWISECELKAWTLEYVASLQDRRRVTCGSGSA